MFLEDLILKNAKTEDVAFLVVGDPFGATTHTDLVLRAIHQEIPYQVVHNASIMNAIGCCGLQLYNFGETVSLVLWTDDWQPDSYFEKIEMNLRNGHHTLCLLDIKVKEQTIENMMKGKKTYEPPRFMTVCQAAKQLLSVIRQKRDEGKQPGIMSCYHMLLSIFLSGVELLLCRAVRRQCMRGRGTVRVCIPENYYSFT
jgi:diphthine synthase